MGASRQPSNIVRILETIYRFWVHMVYPSILKDWHNREYQFGSVPNLSLILLTRSNPRVYIFHRQLRKHWRTSNPDVIFFFSCNDFNPKVICTNAFHIYYSLNLVRALVWFWIFFKISPPAANYITTQRVADTSS